jgi:hypothetical protein
MKFEADADDAVDGVEGDLEGTTSSSLSSPKEFFDPLSVSFLSSCDATNQLLEKVGLRSSSSITAGGGISAHQIGHCYAPHRKKRTRDSSSCGSGSSGTSDLNADDGRAAATTTASGGDDNDSHSSNDITTGTAFQEYQYEYRLPTIRLYGCMQMPKKMHPRFDAVLGGILRADPRARILVMQRAMDLVPRWQRTLGLSAADIRRRILFVPRLEHRDYLRLQALTSAFLNTFPYGAGITSSEALALCLPVVTLPSEISVLQMTLAQVQ